MGSSRGGAVCVHGLWTTRATTVTGHSALCRAPSPLCSCLFVRVRVCVTACVHVCMNAIRSYFGSMLLARRLISKHCEPYCCPAPWRTATNMRPSCQYMKKALPLWDPRLPAGVPMLEILLSMASRFPTLITICSPARLSAPTVGRYTQTAAARRGDGAQPSQAEQA